MPLGAENRHRLNDGATPSNSTGDAPEDHARRQSWKQPHTVKTGRWQRAQPSQKGHPHEQPAARKEPTGVTLSYPSNYANAPRAGSARGPQHPHRAKPDTCLHTPTVPRRFKDAHRRECPHLWGAGQARWPDNTLRSIMPSTKLQHPHGTLRGYSKRSEGNSIKHSHGTARLSSLP